MSNFSIPAFYFYDVRATLVHSETVLNVYLKVGSIHQT